MYSEIASNKRRSAILIVAFFIVWLAIGAGLGALYSDLSHSNVNRRTENRRFVELPSAFGNLAAAIGRERLVETLQEIGTALRHDIVQGHRADDRRGARGRAPAPLHQFVTLLTPSLSPSGTAPRAA